MAQGSFSFTVDFLVIIIITGIKVLNIQRVIVLVSSLFLANEFKNEEEGGVKSRT